MSEQERKAGTSRLVYDKATRTIKTEKTNTALEIKLFDALRAIAKSYQTPDQLRRSAEKEYGLDYTEALEMSYENIQSLAARTIHGLRIKRPQSNGIPAALPSQKTE